MKNSAAPSHSHAEWEERVSSARRKHFPMHLPREVRAEIVQYPAARAVLRKYYGRVFPESRRVFQVPRARRKKTSSLYQHYFASVPTDAVLFKIRGRPIGWSIGEMSDFGTYYMRNTGILPRYRGHRIYSRFLPKFLAYLTDLGFERVISQHLGHNTPVLVAKLRAGFSIVGYEIDERFGVMAKLFYCAHADRRRFLEQSMLGWADHGLR